MTDSAARQVNAQATKEEAEKLVDERYHQKLSRIPHVPPAKKTLRGDTYREVAIEFARRVSTPAHDEYLKRVHDELLAYMRNLMVTLKAASVPAPAPSTDDQQYLFHIEGELEALSLFKKRVDLAMTAGLLGMSGDVGFKLPCHQFVTSLKVAFRQAESEYMKTKTLSHCPVCNHPSFLHNSIGCIGHFSTGKLPQGKDGECCPCREVVKDYSLAPAPSEAPQTCACKLVGRVCAAPICKDIQSYSGWSHVHKADWMHWASPTPYDHVGGDVAKIFVPCTVCDQFGPDNEEHVLIDGHRFVCMLGAPSEAHQKEEE